jgi:hypothetical protein
VPRTPTEWVEIFYGFDAFICAAPGFGTYGFDVVLSVDRPDLLFAGRTLSDQAVLVRPSEGVSIVYRVEGFAECVTDPRRQLITFLSVSHHVSAGHLNALIGRTFNDPLRDFIYSISSILAGFSTPRIDLRAVTAASMLTTQLTNDHNYNQSQFPCGSTVEVDALETPVTTLCATNSVPIPAGEVVVVAATYEDALPAAGDEHHYTYAAVFESNGDPSDDWQFQGGFDWDFFIGTDRWYQAHWDPGSGTWTLVVSNTLTNGGPSGVRALIMGDTILWIIPKSELPAEVPGVRVTSFVHDGSYRAEVSGGDVNGADPTEPLIPVEPIGG